MFPCWSLNLKWTSVVYLVHFATSFLAWFEESQNRLRNFHAKSAKLLVNFVNQTLPYQPKSTMSRFCLWAATASTRREHSPRFGEDWEHGSHNSSNFDPMLLNRCQHDLDNHKYVPLTESKRRTWSLTAPGFNYTHGSLMHIDVVNSATAENHVHLWCFEWKIKRCNKSYSYLAPGNWCNSTFWIQKQNSCNRCRVNTFRQSA